MSDNETGFVTLLFRDFYLSRAVTLLQVFFIPGCGCEPKSGPAMLVYPAEKKAGRSAAAAQSPEVLRRTDRGFTLLEVLIVLVLLSLVVSLLAGGLSMTFSLRERLLDQQQQLRVQTLQSHWFRSVCSSFTPEQKPGGEQFSGTPLRVRGLTLSPLLSAAGAPRLVEFLLEQQGPVVVLRYRQDAGKPLEIGRWQADSGRFVFFDAEWNKQDRWPPRTFHESARLPRAIMLELDRPGAFPAWFAPVTGRTQPRPWVDLNEL